MADLHRLVARSITQEAFLPYGQIILPSEDGQTVDGSEAQLDLSQGTPRFYIMRLSHRGRRFHKITRHLKCTQCLGSLGGKSWFLAVCLSSESTEPDLDKMSTFEISGDRFIKLEKGTWHAGPYFDEPVMDFYNLELSDTNETDHFTHDFLISHQLQFEII